MATIDMKAIWRDVKANAIALDSCPGPHTFPAGAPGLGNRWTCSKCGGKVDGAFVLAYCAGWQAAGADPALIWPDYVSNRANAREVMART